MTYFWRWGMGSVAAALIGRADECDGERDEWPHYVERLKFLFKASGIDDAERQRAVFLTSALQAPAESDLTRLARREDICRTGRGADEALQPSAFRNPTNFKQRTRKPGEVLWQSSGMLPSFVTSTRLWRTCYAIRSCMDGIQQKCLLKNSHLPESFGAIPGPRNCFQEC